MKVDGKRLIRKLGYHGVEVFKNPGNYKQRLDYNFERFLADNKAKKGLYSYPHNIIFLAGMGLGGSTWLKNLLARIPGYYTRSTPMPWEVYYNQNFCDSGFSRTPNKGYSLFKTHLNPSVENLNCLNRNGVTKILVSYRDYRDVLLSLTHRLIKFPKEKDSWDYVDLNAMGFDKALEHLINLYSADFIDWVEGWFELARQDPDRYHFVKFEDLSKDTEKIYRGILNFYGVNLSDSLIKNNILQSKGNDDVEKNLSASKVLPWGLSSNFRSGKTGGWRDEFSPHHIELCKEKLGLALITAGYEKDLDWGL